MNKLLIRHLQANATGYLIGIALLLVALRIAILPVSPPPFAADEALSGAHIAAMVTKGHDANGTQWPLFSSALGGGYVTPTYLYPAAAWASVFGYEPLSLRYFSQFATLLAIVMIALAVRLWSDRRTALIALAVGLALPWGWLQGSIAWDPAIVPFYTSAAFLAFSLLFAVRSRAVRFVSFFVMTAMIVALAYAYPPLRVGAPLLLAGSYFLLYRQSLIDIRHIVAGIIFAGLLALPLAGFILQPGALDRSQNLLVFHEWPFPVAIIVFLLNMLHLVSPWFLFLLGDPNLRHATGFQGMLGLAALPGFIGLVAIITRFIKTKKVSYGLPLLAAGFGVIASLVGSALTYEGQPHSLRATAAWPFIIVQLAFGWRWIFALKNKRWIYLSVALFIVGTAAYAYDLAYLYPERSQNAFDHSIYEKATTGQPTPPYPSAAIEYYKSL